MKKYDFEPGKYEEQLKEIIKSIISEIQVLDRDGRSQGKLRMIISQKINNILRRFPKDNMNLFSRDELISGYRYFVEQKILKQNEKIIQVLKLKPIRTISGIIPITLLTKPFPCPGKCIFCPNDIRMPKSYIASEPGAQRALRNAFDPYSQTYNRLLALYNIGHNTNKVELIILGGTWSYYLESYQIWFIKRCFEAMNDFGTEIDQRFAIPEPDFTDTLSGNDGVVNYNDAIAKGSPEDKPIGKTTPGTETATWEELTLVQEINETAKSRCVGLVLETRPDFITEKEVIRLRRLGATKIQMGIQTLDNKILQMNKRGTTVDQIKNAFTLLRTAGFKIHAHLMPNLYGANVKSDKSDYLKLWNKDFCPDELKIYPTSIIKGTELTELYKQGKYRPYSTDELKELLKFCFENTPRFVRLTRIIRDIPAPEITAGNKTSNLRQIVELEMLKEGKPCKCIRCREIQNRAFNFDKISLEKISYKTSIGKDIFISFITNDISDKIIGFLRLTLPSKEKASNNFISELKNSAIIREVHVYGQVEKLGDNTPEHAQHSGIGSKLLMEAEKISGEAGFSKIAVISAIGTRNYYNKFNYKLGKLYQTKVLSTN